MRKPWLIVALSIVALALLISLPSPSKASTIEWSLQGLGSFTGSFTVDTTATTTDRITAWSFTVPAGTLSNINNNPATVSVPTFTYTQANSADETNASTIPVHILEFFAAANGSELFITLPSNIPLPTTGGTVTPVFLEEDGYTNLCTSPVPPFTSCFSYVRTAGSLASPGTLTGTLQTVPEPNSLSLLEMGLAALVAVGRKKGFLTKVA